MTVQHRTSRHGQSGHADTSRPIARAPRAVWYALASNIAVALCKFAAAVFTNSGSVLAEAIHSSADCLNQIVLLFGNRAVRTGADDLHPLGFAREMHFYAMLVALQILLVGGVASVVTGVVRLIHRSPLEHPYVVVAVLCVSGVIEGIALKSSIGTIERRRLRGGLWQWFRETGKPDVMLAVGEDAAAVAGVVVSLVAIGLSIVTGSPVYDAVGALGVGAVLMGTALLSLREIKSLIVGKAAHEEVRTAMRAWLSERAEITGIVSLIVLRWGDDHVVAVQAVLEPQQSANELIEAIDHIERALHDAFPTARWIFFEPERGDHETGPL